MAIFTSKTYFDCIESAAQKATEFGVGLDTRVVLFCEDKFALALEKALVSKAGGAFGAEVLSFGRYISKVFPERNTLSKEGSAMAVKKILSEKKDCLRVLGGMSHSPSLAVKTAELIAQLKSAKVTPDDLSGCLDGCPLNVAAKLHDVALIYQGYENLLSEKGLTDSSNSLSDMLVALEKDETMPLSHVVLVGYSSVTKQSCEVMKKLSAICKSCDFYTVAGSNTDLYTNEFLSFVLKLTEEKAMLAKSSLCKEAEVILDTLFNPESFSKEGLYSDKVHIFEAKSILEEVDYTCAQIKKRVAVDGYRFSDIAIGVNDGKAYSLLLKRKLSDYQIPYFADEKRTLCSHPVSKLVLHAVKAALRKDLSEIKRVLRSSLFIPEKNLSDKLLRLITEGSVTARSFILGDDFIPDSPRDGGENFDNAVLRGKCISLARFLRGFPQRATAKAYADLTEKFARDSVGDVDDLSSPVNRLSKRLEDMEADEEKTFLLSGITGFFAVLDEIREVLGEETISGEDFLKVLISGEEASEISLIPQYLDCVYIAEIKNLRFEKRPCVYIMGLSGDVPSIKADTALLLDSDISKLEELAVSVEPKIRVVNDREKEATALAFACFSDELNLSYSLTNAEGKATVRSEIVDYIEAAFSSADKKLEIFNALSLSAPLEGEAEDYRQSLQYISLRPAMLSLLSESDDYKNGAISDLTGASSFLCALERADLRQDVLTAESLVKNVNEDIKVKADFPPSNCFSKGAVSASFIETFYSCPYKCFLKYGVGVKDSLSSEIRSLDFGNILHNVAELFSARLGEVENEEDCKKIANELTDKIFEEEKYSRFLKRSDFAYSSLLTKKEAEKLCVELFNQSKNSQFKTVGNEVWLAKLPLLSKKGIYHLVGKVDRVDKYKNYVRIIDYKTGNAKNKSAENNFYAGQNLQLYLYLNAFTANGDKPAGAYYYAVNDDFKKEDESTSVMYGKTLDDEEIITASDQSLADGSAEKSTVHEIKKKTTKNGTSYDGKIADERAMRGYMKYAKLMVEQAVDNVLDGVVIPSPYEKSCDYCEFGGICGRDVSKKSGYRSVKGVKSEHIIQAVEKAENIGGGEEDGE